MSDKIELMKLCGVLQSKFSCLSQSESRTQPCHVRMAIFQLCHKVAYEPRVVVKRLGRFAKCL